MAKSRILGEGYFVTSMEQKGFRKFGLLIGRRLRPQLGRAQRFD